MKTFIYHTDPSHGWLAVKISMLSDLNLLDKISVYSFIRGNTVYLEEDVDAKIFYDAFTKKHGEFDTQTKYYDRRNPIRSYVSYTPEKAQEILGHNKKFNPFKKKEEEK